MAPISYARHRFPPAVIRHAVWLYFRFTLSFRDVEELLAERGIEVSYESVRRWVLKFGPLFARELRRRRPRPSSQWHLDEMAVQIGGKRVWLWRAVDSEGEVLDLLVQPRRDKAAAVKLMRKLLKKQGYAPTVLVTDKLRSYGAARTAIGMTAPPRAGSSREQPSRELASACPAPGAEDAAIQVGRLSPALPVRPFRRPQHLQRPASPDLPSHAADLQSRSPRRLAGRNSGMIATVPGTLPHVASRVAVTMPLTRFAEAEGIALPLRHQA